MQRRPSRPHERVHVRRPIAGGERRQHHDSFEIEQFWLAAPLRSCEK